MFARAFAAHHSRIYLAQCLGFLAILIVIFSIASPYFLHAGNVLNILSAGAVIGLMATGATFVIASGAIDLSSAAVMGLSGTVCAYALQKMELPPFAAIAGGIGTGALCGLTTGFLINLTRAPSFIVTLGMMSIVRAAAYILSNGTPIYGLPDAFVASGQYRLAGLPVPAIVLFVGIAAGWMLLTRMRFGTHTLIFGDNPVAAEAMGISTKWLRLKIFTLAGLYSGIAGIIFTLRTNAGDPSAGQGYELIAITAVILGGANLFGGRATILGTVIGFLCLGVLQNGLNLFAVSTYYQILFVGMVLIAAAFLSRLGSQK
jgi:ribose transport system permease protein/inositol transport system permease protein